MIRIRAAGFALTLIGLFAHADIAIAARVLTADGLEAVHFGMSVAEIEKALGVKLKPDPPEAAEPCWYGVRVDRVDPGIGYMIENGRLTRIDVSVPRTGTTADVSVEGNITIGSPTADVQKVYGIALTTRPSDSNPGQVEIHIGSNKDRAIVLALAGGRVSSFRSGVMPSVGYPEGCS